jgi:hypothetical protein
VSMLGKSHVIFVRFNWSTLLEIEFHSIYLKGQLLRGTKIIRLYGCDGWKCMFW